MIRRHTSGVRAYLKKYTLCDGGEVSRRSSEKIHGLKILTLSLGWDHGRRCESTRIGGMP